MTDPLIVDVYQYDIGGKPDWPKLVAAGPPWHGAIIKASEGVGGNVKWQREGAVWTRANWPAIRTAAGDRYGVDFWRGAYHYLLTRGDGRAQAEHYLRTIEDAGGWDQGDIFPIVDVEEGSGNDGTPKQQVIDCTTAWAEKVKIETGRDVILYAGHWVVELGIRDRMGCALLIYAAYTARLNAATSYAALGRQLSELWGWQYCGDGQGYVQGYPMRSPIGDVDISALTIAGGGAKALEWMRSNLVAEDPDPSTLSAPSR